ncbi:MAG: Lambda phage tail tube protein [Pseudomonadota bacterium]|jgi:hypothetical protein
MPVTPIDSQGTQLFCDGLKVIGVKAVTGLGSGSSTVRDRSTLDDSKFKRIGVGLRDSGTASVPLLIDTTDAGQRRLYKYYKDGTRGYFQVVLPNGSQRDFYAYVQTFPEDFGTDADAMATVTLLVDGEIGGFPDPS